MVNLKELLRDIVNSPAHQSARWLQIFTLLLLAALILGRWPATAYAQNALWFSGAAVSATSQDPNPSNNGASLCLAATSSGVLVNTANVQSSVTDPNPTNNDAALCLPQNTATVIGRAWEDSNGNGWQEANEPGLAGVPIQLLNNDGALLQTTTSAASGAYQLTGLAAGLYRLRFLAPNGYQFTQPDQGADDTLDSDVDPTTGRSAVITLNATGGGQNWDAGLYRPVSVGDHIWEDRNSNGQQEADEPGLADITVQLFDSHNALIASTTTDASGDYYFGDLPPGDYYLIVVPPVHP